MTATTILVIDDEPQEHRFLRPALQAAGYGVERADSAAEGLRLAASRSPAAVLLDLGLPDLDGQDALVQLRAITQAPIIVVSARDREAEKIRALNAGADDYVEKPFAVGELLARVRACIRRELRQDGAAVPWRRGGVAVDLVYRRVSVAGAEVTLSPREYDLLAFLVRHAGRVVTHRQLLTGGLGRGACARRSNICASILAICGRSWGPRAPLIVTEAGIGYRFAEAEG